MNKLQVIRAVANDLDTILTNFHKQIVDLPEDTFDDGIQKLLEQRSTAQALFRQLLTPTVVLELTRAAQWLLDENPELQKEFYWLSEYPVESAQRTFYSNVIYQNIGLIVDLDQPSYNYWQPVTTGAFSALDCYLVNDTGQRHPAYETPLAIRAEDIGAMVDIDISKGVRFQ